MERTRIEEYLQQISIIKAAGTIEQYRGNLRRAEQSLGVPLETATRPQLLRLVESLTQGPNTSANVIYAIRAFFAWLVEMEHRVDDPAGRRLRAPKRPEIAPRPAPPDVIAKAMTYATQTGQWDIRFAIGVEYGSGARCAEVCHLTSRSRVDYPEPLLTLHGKGNRTRQVPFTDFLSVEWDLYLTHRVDARSGPILQRRDGQPGEVRPNTLTGYVSKCFRDIGETYTGHCNRKTAGTEMSAQEGSDIAVIAKFLGHKDLNTTVRHYVLPNMDKARGMAEGLPRLDVPYQRTGTSADIHMPSQDSSHGGLRVIRGGRG